MFTHGTQANKRVRITINDIINENTENLYVRVRATEYTKQPTNVHLSVKSRNNGDPIPIEVPMTYIPYNLANHAPKEDIVGSTDFRRMLSMGIFELVLEEEANKELNTPDAQAELDRLRANMFRRVRAVQSADGEPEDLSIKALLPQEFLAKGAPGDIDTENVGVAPAIIDIVSSDADDAQRRALVRNILPTLTDADRRYLRSNTKDRALHELLG